MLEMIRNVEGIQVELKMATGSDSSHEIPVQSFILHLAHQVHQAPFEEDFESQVVFDHQRDG